MPRLMRWATPPALPSAQARAHDLQGAEVLLAQIAADTLISNKAFDAHERVIDRLKRNGKSTVIPVSYTHLTLPTNREV